MRFNRPLFVICACLMVFAQAALAKGHFRQIIPELVQQGQTFQISYELTSDKEIAIDECKINFVSSIPHCKLLYGPAYSIGAGSFVAFSGNKLQNSSSFMLTITYTYKVLSGKSIPVPSLKLTTPQGVYVSKPGVIKVNANSGGSSGNGSAFDRGDGKPQKIFRPTSKDLFLRAEVSNKQPYQSEGVLYQLKLYSDPNIKSLTATSMHLVEFSDFLEQSIEVPDRAKIVDLNGRKMICQVVKESILIPQKEGAIVIPKNEIQLDVSVPRPMSEDDLFGFSDGTASYPMTVTSAPVQLNVKQLPQPQPNDFALSVGKYKMTAEISKPPYKAHEAITLKLKVYGSGNIKFLKEPKVAWPKSFDTYPVKSDTELDNDQDGVSGVRIFEYTVVPQIEGQFKIPPVTMSYFEPQSGTYKRISAGGYDLNILKNEDAGGIATGSNDMLIMNFFNPIKPFHKGQGPDSRLGIGFFILVYLLLTGATAATYVFVSKRQKNAADKLGLRKVRAGAVAQKHLKDADKLRSQKQTSAFYDEAHRALWGYFADKLSIPSAELNKDLIVEKLQQAGFDAVALNEVSSLLEDCEFARFAPGADSAEGMDRLYDRIAGAINHTEEKLS